MDRGRGVVCTRENRVLCTRETWFVCTCERIIFMDFIYFIWTCASFTLISSSMTSCFAYSLLFTEDMHAASSASPIHINSIIRTYCYLHPQRSESTKGYKRCCRCYLSGSQEIVGQVCVRSRKVPLWRMRFLFACSVILMLVCSERST